MSQTSSSEPSPSEHARRRAELARNLAGVRGRIDAACAAAGRDSGDVTLIAVTKTRPAADVMLLAELGVTDIGENRDQEAAPKAAACAGLRITWHFIGQLQTNKAASVARYADVVHSVDRLRLVHALGAARSRGGRPRVRPAWSRSASMATRPGAGCRPVTLTRVGGGAGGGARPPARRGDGGGTARHGTGRGLRSAARLLRHDSPGPAGSEHHLRGHER